MEIFVGTIALWPLDWAPQGWLLCQGQALSVKDKKYELLFNILGITYGGDGKNTFNLPDLRGRAVLGAGISNDKLIYRLADQGGTESTSLSITQMPYHSHQVRSSQFDPFKSYVEGELLDGESEAVVQLPSNASSLPGNLTSSPTAQTTMGIAATFDGKGVNMYSTNPPDVQLKGSMATASGPVSGRVSGRVRGEVSRIVSTASTGAGAPFSVMQPYIALSYIICYAGDYPPRT